MLGGPIFALLLLVRGGVSMDLAAARVHAAPAAHLCLSATPPVARSAPPVAFFDSLKQNLQQLGDFRVARASHILLKGFDEATVQQLEAWKVEIGDDEAKFAEIARTHSVCPSRQKGGDLGFFTRGKMVKEFDNVVFSEEPGAVYGPVRSDFGHHLIYLHSCRTPS